jgi:hypothetical protein
MNKQAIKIIPPELVTEADNLSKETGLPFRDILGILMNAYLRQEESCPVLTVRT